MLRWNAIVILQICGSIWYHALGAMISTMNEWQMAWCTVFFTTHILKCGRRSRCVHLLPSHYMMILTHKILRIQHPQIILHLHCGEHPDQLHHRLVWKQRRWQPQSSAKSCANCPPHCWRWASLPPGHLHQAVYKESPEDHQWLQPPVPQTVLSAALRNFNSNTVQNWTTRTHCTNTTIYLLPLDTIQCTSMTFAYPSYV